MADKLTRFTIELTNGFSDPFKKTTAKQEDSVEGDALDVYLFVEEKGGAFAEFGGGFCGEVLAGASTCEPYVHFWVAMEIVLKAGGDVLTLGNEFCS